MSNEGTKRIRLTLEEPGGIERTAWPVTQGIPFAVGELRRGDPVRVVTESGDVLASQAQCLATWRADLEDVKWLLVDFQAGLPAGAARSIFLEYGPATEAVPAAQQIRVEQTERHIDIDTGPLRVRLRKGDPDFFASCCVRAGDEFREALRGRPGPYLYMTDQNGVHYDSCEAAPAPTVEIEEDGPIRASVRISGFHASDDGRRFCPYVLRLHFFAGRADIRCCHTFVFDQDPERLELSEVGMCFPVRLGDNPRVAFGGESTTHWADSFTAAELVQTSDLEYEVTRDDAPFGSGERTSGWGSLSGAELSVAVVVRDLWKEYPKGISADPDGVVDVQIWPLACGETLKFSTPFKETAARFGGTRDEEEFRRIIEENPTAPLNLKSLAATNPEDLLWVEEMVARYAPDRPASYNDTGTEDGMGAARTTEFLLSFAESPISDEEAERLAVCVQEPLIAPPEPAYACATDAMRPMAPIDPERFAEAEAGLADLFDRIVVEPRRALRAYGMIDYGDLICSHSGSPAALWEMVKDGPDVIERMKYCSRAYNNESNDQLNAMWGFFTHSGERRYFLAAEAFGRHMADVDICHGPAHAGRTGLIHYHNCDHWTGGPSPSHTCMAGLMLQYYLTGNRRIFDVCGEIADWVMAQQEPCGIFRNSGALVREFTTPVANLLEFYQATWDRRYFELARRSLRWLLKACPEPGSMPQSIYTGGERGDEAEVEHSGSWHLRQAGGMTPQLLYDADHLMGAEDPIYREALIAMADRYVHHSNDVFEVLRVGPKKVEQLDPYFNAAVVAYAYALTEEPAYAAYCRYYLREHFPERSRQMSFTYVCWGSIVPPLMEAVRRAEIRHGVEALDRAEEDWIRQVEERQPQTAVPKLAGSRPERRSIGVITGYE